MQKHDKTIFSIFFILLYFQEQERKEYTLTPEMDANKITLNALVPIHYLNDNTSKTTEVIINCDFCKDTKKYRLKQVRP